MLISVIPIGNSKGVRIPKNVLSALNIRDKAEMEIRENEIVIKPIETKAREGWDTAFSQMNTENEDTLLIPDIMDTDTFEWEW